jgi:transposase-like protein
MSISEGLNTKTALEHLIFLSEKNTITVCRELGVTPQQFTDWIKLRRPIPEERLRQLESYFSVPTGLIADDKRFAKRLSRLDGISLEMLIVSNKMKLCASWEFKKELEYRLATLKSEQDMQLRIARLSALLERGDAGLLKKIDAFLDELEAEL